ncbi:MAG: hypothetical protein ACRDPC_10945 [Solirubrobacteraceae bacterium]
MHPLIAAAVTTNITMDRRELAAREHRPVARHRSVSQMPAPVVIRPATAVDADDLARLAELDSAPPLRGEVVLAYAGGDIRAALSVDSGRAVADPFWHSAELVELLREAVRPESSRRRRERRFVRRREAALA